MHILKEWSRKFNSSPHCHCRYQHDRQISGLSPQTFLATPRSTPTPASIHGRITSSRGKDQHQKEQEFSASSTQYSSVDYWARRAPIPLKYKSRNSGKLITMKQPQMVRLRTKYQSTMQTLIVHSRLVC
jgi:hypothetical protein